MPQDTQQTTTYRQQDFTEPMYLKQGGFGKVYRFKYTGDDPEIIKYRDEDGHILVKVPKEHIDLKSPDIVREAQIAHAMGQGCMLDNGFIIVRPISCGKSAKTGESLFLDLNELASKLAKNQLSEDMPELQQFFNDHPDQFFMMMMNGTKQAQDHVHASGFKHLDTAAKNIMFSGFERDSKGNIIKLNFEFVDWGKAHGIDERVPRDPNLPIMGATLADMRSNIFTKPGELSLEGSSNVRTDTFALKSMFVTLIPILSNDINLESQFKTDILSFDNAGLTKSRLLEYCKLIKKDGKIVDIEISDNADSNIISGMIDSLKEYYEKNPTTEHGQQQREKLLAALEVYRDYVINVEPEVDDEKLAEINQSQQIEVEPGVDDKKAVETNQPQQTEVEPGVDDKKTVETSQSQQLNEFMSQYIALQNKYDFYESGTKLKDVKAIFSDPYEYKEAIKELSELLDIAPEAYQDDIIRVGLHFISQQNDFNEQYCKEQTKQSHQQLSKIIADCKLTRGDSFKRRLGLQSPQELNTLVDSRQKLTTSLEDNQKLLDAIDNKEVKVSPRNHKALKNLNKQLKQAATALDKRIEKHPMYKPDDLSNDHYQAFTPTQKAHQEAHNRLTQEPDRNNDTSRVPTRTVNHR